MIHIHFRHRENAPPLRVVRATLPPLRAAQVSALADMVGAPLRLARRLHRGDYPGVFRGRSEHSRATLGALAMRGLAISGEDEAGPFVEITPAGLALIEGAQPCLLPSREKVPAQQADEGGGKP
jgi:hypothetical protein